MPKLSDTMSEGTLVKWLKKEGDTVSMDEDIAEVETDKATMTMPSFDEGILHKIYVKEGETVVTRGTALALILDTR
jgi:pyruvate/2-oxoglutarate dehydrogenase complex dihydrolipoamide acyltransferase (E2) component